MIMNKRFLSFVAAAALIGAASAFQANAATVNSDDFNMELTTGKPKKKTKKTSSKKTTRTSSTKTTPAKTETTNTQEPETTTETSTENSSGSLFGTILGGLTGSSSSSSSSSGVGGLISSLTSIFDASKTATTDQLVGTWKYTEPAIVFESDNALQNIGGKVASATIEKKLQQQFSKYGIKKGAMKMTFDKDGNFTQTIGSKTLSGTYTVSGKEVKLTYTGGISQLVGTTQVSGSSLLIVMKADKLLKYAGTLGKLTGNSTVSTLSSLLGSYDGMEIGLRLEK